MRTFVIAVAAAALAAGAATAQGRGPPGGAPPGLAKKPDQAPPGQAKKAYGRGERLPLTYLQSRYYISEPSRYQLAPAPPGFRWVLVDEHAYLANAQTGMIAEVILNLLSR